MTHTTALNALCAALIALVLGTAHLLGPDEITAAQDIAADRAEAQQQALADHRAGRLPLIAQAQ